MNKNKQRTRNKGFKKSGCFFKESKTKGRLIEQEENNTNNHTLFFFLDFFFKL